MASHQVGSLRALCAIQRQHELPRRAESSAAALLADLRAQGAEFFVSSPPDELPKQPTLFKLLRHDYPLRTRTDDYLIFDLRRRR